MGTGDAWALCSIVWEKPALLGHGVMMTLKGHKLPDPPRLSHTIPLLYLTPSATEHPIIHILPSLGPLSTQQTQRFLNSKALDLSIQLWIPVLQPSASSSTLPPACSLGMCFSIRRSKYPQFFSLRAAGFQ